jgi:glycosyltransferase involved in cell wall biosynthesis
VALLAPRMTVLGADPCGGSEVLLWEDAAILNAAGIPVRVYACAAFDGAPVRVLPLRTSLPLVTSIEYGAQLLRHERKALIIAYNEPSLGGWAPGRVLVRFDWRTPLPRYWNFPVWRSRFGRTQYIFPSEDESRWFQRHHKQIPEHCLSVLPNAVDLQFFRPMKTEAVKQNAETLRVGFAGQWVPRKGIYDLLEAWRGVRTVVPQAELCMAGGAQLWKNVVETPRAAECGQAVQQFERDGLLRTVGALPRSRMPEFWNSVSVAVVPSFYESFGLVALEAMACGVPVVATAVGGLKEMVQDGESGLLVRQGDVVSLAHALTNLLTDEPFRRRLAEGARRRAETYSIERRSRSLLQMLRERE